MPFSHSIYAANATDFELYIMSCCHYSATFAFEILFDYLSLSTYLPPSLSLCLSQIHTLAPLVGWQNDGDGSQLASGHGCG